MKNYSDKMGRVEVKFELDLLPGEDSEPIVKELRAVLHRMAHTDWSVQEKFVLYMDHNHPYRHK